jgi:hypothetical protein
MFRAIAKMAGAMAPVAELGGQALGGERDPKKLDEAQQAADAGLDNLLAIIPTKALVNESSASEIAAMRRDLKATGQLLKTDTKDMVQAAKKLDPGQVAVVGARTAAHLAMLAFDIFAGFGTDFIQGVFKAVFPSVPTAATPPPAKK